jgi:hypothetical protein
MPIRRTTRGRTSEGGRGDSKETCASNIIRVPGSGNGGDEPGAYGSDGPGEEGRQQGRVVQSPEHAKQIAGK